MPFSVRLLMVSVVGLVALGAGPVPAAFADDDDEPKRGSGVEHLDITYDPLLSEDAAITDQQETNFLQPDPGMSGVSCTNEQVVSGPNPAPASSSFQLLYIVPSGTAPASSLDVPQSCSNGAVRPPGIARGSRNMTTWMANQNVGLNYRLTNVNYVHNWTGATYASRSVRRFSSGLTRAQWEAYAMYSGTSSPRLTRLRQELVANGFTSARTKYIGVMDVAAQRTTSGNVVGIAEQGGTYGMTVRYQATTTGSLVTMRYGCATDGDAVLAHESTHLLGADHVTDDARDLMQAVKPPQTFGSSPALTWDTGRNSYHSTVRASAFVGLTNVAGTLYKC